MLVELKTKWFSPSVKVQKDKVQSISGRRYNPGIHEMPEEVKDALPSDAKILDKRPEAEPEEQQVHALSEFDLERASDELAAEKVEKADDEQLKKKQDRMANARAAKGAKKGNKTVE